MFVFRRLVALFALVLSVGSFLEPALGLLRDGAIHHEGSAAALVHSAGGGEHGHEDTGAPAGDHDQQGPHRHGTAADHCTHVHNLALVSSYTLQLVSGTARCEFDEQPFVHATIFRTVLRPPIV